MKVMNIIVLSVNTLVSFWIGLYLGTYHGKDIFRFCRYWKLRAIRWKQGRHKYNHKVILMK